MKTLYFDCSMGAAGDMLTAALLELFDDSDAMIEKLNGLRVPGVVYSKEKCVKCGVTGTRVTVNVNGETESEIMHDHSHDGHHHGHDHEHGHGEHDHSHSHSSLHDIEHTVSHLDIPQKVKDDVLAVYKLIAEAESSVHGVPVSDIHFHEVGTADAIADITAVCLLISVLDPDKIVASPVRVGSGQVRCAHGILPVPAPATAYILKGVPVCSGEIKGELCTPTGAALLKHFVADFSEMPLMKIGRIGYGMGTKDFEAANCVRAFLGETEDRTDTVTVLSCNVDDMTAEEIGFACEMLFDGGALDVYTVPTGMKKSRPGTLIRVICRNEDKEKALGLIFAHTSTLGVREATVRRYVLDRNEKVIKTRYGDVRKKESRGYGVFRSKYEYDDLAFLAKEKRIGIKAAKKIVEEAEKDGLDRT